MKRPARGATTIARAALSLACASALLGLPACSGGGNAQEPPAGSEAAATGTGSPAGKGQDTPRFPRMELDADPGIGVEGAGEGYFCARASSDSRLKFQIAKGNASYNYDLDNTGKTMVFPVNMGDGPYTLRIMQNTTGNSYVELASADVDVELDSEFAPFLLPNAFCSYTADSACVARARELTAACSTQSEMLEAVCTYLAENISYDSAKAQELSRTKGYVPDPDETLETGCGICFDYASLACAMLRSCGIPTKIVTGYVSPGDIYHAWVMVYVDGAWTSTLFSVDSDTWSRVDVTFAAAGVASSDEQDMGYSDKYVY